MQCQRLQNRGQKTVNRRSGEAGKRGIKTFPFSDSPYLRFSVSSYCCHFPQHFLYFFPLPHGHGSFLPTFGPTWTGFGFSSDRRDVCPTSCILAAVGISPLPRTNCCLFLVSKPATSSSLAT